MKLNLGCGHRHLPGFVNVDAYPACNPDMVLDLEETPWPWPDDSVSEVRLIHSLEHLGQTPGSFLAIMRELYRIAVDGCEVVVHVPHPRHDNFLNDPTHVRAINGETLAMFDRQLCEKVIAQGGANTPLALMIGVDFETVRNDTVLEEPYLEKLKSGQISSEEIHDLLRTHNNIASELRFLLRVRKR